MREKISLSHIAIIMDGNGRWAKSNNLPKIKGHQKGASVAKEIIAACIELQIPYLTLYTFSNENWQRNEEEINDLMSLLRLYFKNEVDKLVNQNIRIKFIGDFSKLPDDIRKHIYKVEKLSSKNNALNLIIALSYGGRQEIVQAVKEICNAYKKDQIASSEIDEHLFSNYLYTANIPDPDLLIRTSGEQRISNFLLWQLAYTELYFTPVLWPDFNKANLYQAIKEFESRERRYGKN